MNQRIRELVRQAGGHFSTRALMSNPVQHRESIELWDDKIEKFAELIVQECLGDLKERIALRYQGNYQDRLIGYGMEIVYYDVLDKFGVE
jgi:hypothetical protein